MVKNCGKCAKAINGIEFVVCRGYCGATFHINECSGATRAMLSYFTTHKKNLFWMCDKCADLFENSHFRAISCQADETSPLASLTSAITELRTEIKQLNSKPHPGSTPASSVQWPIINQRRGSKRPRMAVPVARASETCQVGSKKPQENDPSIPICKKEDIQRFWLYLSKIRPDVTVEAVSAMVKANLNIDADPPIVKLVPKGRTIESLSFVSFKIGLDPSLQQIALDPETWPEGLLFREFEDYGAPKFRFPLTTTPSLLTPQAASSPATPVMDLS